MVSATSCNARKTKYYCHYARQDVHPETLGGHENKHFFRKEQPECPQCCLHHCGTQGTGPCKDGLQRLMRYAFDLQRLQIASDKRGTESGKQTSMLGCTS